MDTNYLFIIVTAFLIYMTVRGYKRGFLRIAVTFIGMILILVAVRKASPYISEYLMTNTEAYQKIQIKITEKFAEANLKYDNSIPENQTLTINSYEVPEIIKNNLIVNNTQEMYKNLLVSVFEEYVSAYLAKSAIKAAAFVLTFVVLYIAFQIIMVAVDIISKIPILKGLNKLAGACVGLVEALLTVWIFFIVVVMFIGNDSMSVLLSMISSSKFLSFLFNNNFLLGAIA